MTATFFSNLKHLKFKLVAMTKCVISPNQVSYCAISPKTFGHCASFQKKNSEDWSKTWFFLLSKVKMDDFTVTKCCYCHSEWNVVTHSIMVQWNKG